MEWKFVEILNPRAHGGPYGRDGTEDMEGGEYVEGAEHGEGIGRRGSRMTPVEVSIAIHRDPRDISENDLPRLFRRTLGKPERRNSLGKRRKTSEESSKVSGKRRKNAEFSGLTRNVIGRRRCASGNVGIRRKTSENIGRPRKT
eukprot:gene12392-biopygen8148